MKVFVFLILSLALYSQAVFAKPMVGGWTSVNPDTVNNNPAIQEALIFGANYAIHHGIEEGTIEDADYQIINIFSVRQQLVAGINYEFEVELATDSEYYVKLTYVVFVQSWKKRNSKKVTSFEFSPLLQQGDIDNGESEFDFLPEDLSDDDGSRLLAASSEMAGGWTPVATSQLNSDSNLKSAFNFGIQQALQTLVQNNSLPQEIYHESRIYSIESQVVNGYNYRFDVQVKGNKGATARIIFEVYSQPSAGTQQLTSSDVVSESN